MAEFDDKLNSILSNPQMMQQIMSMASAFGQQQSGPASPPPQQAQTFQSFQQPAQNQQMPFDPAAMQGMMELLRGTQLDQKPRNLIQALGAYLPQEKVVRLQKAMQASKVARFASAALNRQQSGR